MTDEAKALAEQSETIRSQLYLDLVANDTQHKEMLALIKTQAREIEQLSYALGCIANEDWKDMTVGSARDLARAALGDSYDQ